MRKLRTFARCGGFAAASVLAMASSAQAQNTAPSSGPVADTQPSDIIVQARRRAERLQDVPKAVVAVTADELRKNNIQKFDDVGSLIAGVTLQNAGNGLVQNASIRGASFDVDSSLPAATVQFYLNDGHIDPNTIFQSMYDVGQLEFLKGPQGVLRGQSAPSGSITVTTHLPDLYKFGGDLQFTDDTATGKSQVGGIKGDYALNIPIIPGKLAIRAAGTVDLNNANGIRTAYQNLYPEAPYNRTWSERLSLRAKPIDGLEINLMYQRMVNRQRDFLQTESTCLIDPTVACNAYPGGSAIVSPRDQMSTINGFQSIYEQENIWNGRVDWHVLGQKLSYVGLYSLQQLNNNIPEDGANWYNTPGEGAGSTFYGIPIGGTQNPYNKAATARSQDQSHEFRISNDERVLGLFDYVLGYNTYDNGTDVAVSAGGYYPAFALSTNYAVGRNETVETAFFGNLTAHPTEKLEISGGLRHLTDRQFSTAPNGGAKTQTARVARTIWAASASYHFTPDFMAYVNAGSSFRPGGQNLGLAYAPYGYGATPLGAAYSNITTIGPESSTTFEVGFKSQMFERRLTFNLDYFHQSFNGYQYISPDYIETAGFELNATNTGIVLPPVNLIIPPIALGTLNVPAKIDGIEGDFAYRLAREASFGGSFSYVNGRVTGGVQVPCYGNPANLNGVNAVNLCPAGPTSNAPRFTATLHADYAHQFDQHVTGFVRGQASIYGATPYNPAAVAYDKVGSYAIANFYAGFRAPDHAWEVTFFLKNAFANSTRTVAYGGNINANTGEQAKLPFPAPATAAGPVYSNYTYIGTPTPRTMGVTVRYSFGSR